MFLSCSLFKSQYRIIKAFEERQATLHHGLPVHGIDRFLLFGKELSGPLPQGAVYTAAMKYDNTRQW